MMGQIIFFNILVFTFELSQLFLRFGFYLDFPTETSKDFSNFTSHPTPLDSLLKLLLFCNKRKEKNKENTRKKLKAGAGG
jgi:hypothetical protein